MVLPPLTRRGGVVRPKQPIGPDATSARRRKAQLAAKVAAFDGFVCDFLGAAGRAALDDNEPYVFTPSAAATSPVAIADDVASRRPSRAREPDEAAAAERADTTCETGTSADVGFDANADVPAGIDPHGLPPPGDVPAPPGCYAVPACGAPTKSFKWSATANAFVARGDAFENRRPPKRPPGGYYWDRDIAGLGVRGWVRGHRQTEIDRRVDERGVRRTAILQDARTGSDFAAHRPIWSRVPDLSSASDQDCGDDARPRLSSRVAQRRISFCSMLL